MVRVAHGDIDVPNEAIDVIVVEDDRDARSMIYFLLSTNGCVVRAFGDAGSAHQGALARVPDVVVSDLRLVGGAAGWTLAQALREDARTRHIALIAVTGVVEPAHWVVRAFDAYLRKPVETTLMLDLVRQLAVTSRHARHATPSSKR